jgi:hypothetical protein
MMQHEDAIIEIASVANREFGPFYDAYFKKIYDLSITKPCMKPRKI